MAAESCLATLKESCVYHFGLSNMWARMEELRDKSYHAKASRHNARLIGLHLAWIA